MQLVGGGRESELTELFENHYRRLTDSSPPPVSLSFYPYSNLNHTIRRRQGRIIVRISDILSDAPREVLSGLLVILLLKLQGRRVPSPPRRLYREYICLPQIRERALAVRRNRGRKRLTPERGAFFDLRRISENLSRRHFQGRLHISRLSWSVRRNRRVLGHYDPAHDTIVIDRRLDRPSVPRYVVEFVIFHEMLHAHFGERIVKGRRMVHHRTFRDAEQRFPDYEKAQRFIRTRL